MTGPPGRKPRASTRRMVVTLAPGAALSIGMGDSFGTQAAAAIVLVSVG